MKEKELRRLSRADLLEMLIDQSKELQEVREKLHQAEAELKKREIAIQNAGSIAEASLVLNGVFEAAQAACREYVENTHKYCERQEPVCVPSYETAAYPKPAFTSQAVEQKNGIPYEQYLQQEAFLPPHYSTSGDYAPARQNRTARYMRIANEMDLQKR